MFPANWSTCILHLICIANNFLNHDIYFFVQMKYKSRKMASSAEHSQGQKVTLWIWVFFLQIPPDPLYNWIWTQLSTINRIKTNFPRKKNVRYFFIKSCFVSFLRKRICTHIRVRIWTQIYNVVAGSIAASGTPAMNYMDPENCIIKNGLC